MAATPVTDDQFETEVLGAGKPALVDFWAEWCGPCKMIGPIVDEISEERDDLAVFKIDVDENPNMARQFGVMSIPTLLLFKDGEMVGRIVGAKPKAGLLAEIEPHL